MSDDTPANDGTEEVDVTKAWAANEGQKGKAKKLRTFAGLSWFVAIATEIGAIVLLLKNTFDSGGLGLMLSLIHI